MKQSLRLLTILSIAAALPMTARAAQTTPAGRDQATKLIAGTCTSSCTSDSTDFLGAFNISVWGTFTGSCTPFRSFNGGAKFIAAGAPKTGDETAIADEPEPGVLYRMSCSITSGTANYRISK